MWWHRHCYSRHTTTCLQLQFFPGTVNANLPELLNLLHAEGNANAPQAEKRGACQMPTAICTPGPLHMTWSTNVCEYLYCFTGRNLINVWCNSHPVCMLHCSFQPTCSSHADSCTSAAQPLQTSWLTPSNDFRVSGKDRVCPRTCEHLFPGRSKRCPSWMSTEPKTMPSWYATSTYCLLIGPQFAHHHHRLTRCIFPGTYFRKNNDIITDLTYSHIC